MTQQSGSRPEPLDPFVHDAAAYVLGILDPGDVTAFETHLVGCARCQAAVDDVAAMPALLDRVPRDVVDALAGLPDVPAGSTTTGVVPSGIEGPPVSLLADLLRTARREQRTVSRRRWMVGAVAAAAVVAVTLAVSGILGGPAGRSGPGGVSAPPVASAPIVLVPVAASAPVTASVDLQQVAWGTRISLSCRYADTGPSYHGPAPAYSLVVRDAQGHSEEVATWAAIPGKDLTVPASTVMRRADIVEVELRAADGTPVLTARF